MAISNWWLVLVKLVTSGTNNHNSCKIKHTLPYNLNICYGIHPLVTKVNMIGIQIAVVMHYVFIYCTLNYFAWEI